MKKEKQERRLYFRAAMLLLVMMLTTVTTWADNYETLKSTTKTWENNTYVTNGNVTIANRITVKGNVTLILTDGYILTASKGIEVSEGNSLTIEGGTNGTGKLIIEGCAEGKAGIGGGDGTPVKYGNITINGGIVNVTGGKKGGAGIGGNNNSITGCGTITINGGIVNATGGTGAAGIGGVIYGDITINGGIVNVKGGDQSAGIGGNYNSECSGNGTITINGGIVNATGGKKAAGIGGGNCGDGAKGGCGDIVINGGQVTATGGGDGPGIGPGKGDAKKNSGSLVLGWTNTTDFIKVTGVKSNLRVVYGFSDRLKSINFAEEDKKFNIVGGGEATIKDITNLESVELIPKGSEQHQLSEATISGISASYDLTGSYLDIPFSVSDAEENKLTLGTDYTATLGTTSQESPTIHITEGGKYTLTITGKDSYAGSKSVDFEVISIGFKKDANGVDYINMPKTGIDDANIPEGVSSFKVYDDGGAKAKYSNYCDGGLVLKAPDNHVLQLTGTVTAEVQGKELKDYLMVYDGGSTSAQKIGDKYGSESGENIGTLISSGTQMTLTFHSDVNGPKDGLNLTVTLKRDIRSCDIANIDDQTYTGSAFEPDLVITYEGTALVKDVDYEVTYSDKTTVGTATITITGKGNYAKTTSKTFNIVKATPNVSAPAAVENLIYTGGSLNLVAAGTTDFGTLLYSLDGQNYSADIPTGTDAGTYTVYYKVEGSDNWNKVEAQSITVTIDKATPYVKTTPTASAITYGQTLSDSELNDGVIQISENIATEIAGTFAWTNKSVKPSVTDSENTEYEVTFTPDDSENCKSVTTNVTLKVNKATPTVTAPIANTLIYNGCEQELVTAGSTDFGTLLYSLNDETYSENIPTATSAGTYTVYYKVEGSDNWNAVAAQTIQATIVKDVTCSDISITIPEQTYTGSELTPVITMKDGEAELTKNTDYTVTAPSGTIKDAGNYTYTITGQGNYKGETTATFTIAPKAVTNDGITVAIPSQPWTGSELTPVITVKDGEIELIENTDYTVTAPSGTVQDAGNYIYTITGKGNYFDSKEATFTISPRLARQAGAVYIYQDQNGMTALLDGTSVEAVYIDFNHNIIVNHVTSNRTFTPGKASTVMLPFNYECSGDEGGTFYKFVGVEKENNVWVATMQETGNDANSENALIANTPYLFMPTATGMSFPNINGSVTLNTTGGGNCETAESGSHWTFKGTYEYMKWTTDTSDPGYNAEREAEIGKVYGFAAVEKTGIHVGDFVRVASGAKIRPMCAYLKWKGSVSNNARAMTRSAAATEELPQSITVKLVGANGEVTGIGTIDTKTGEMTFDSEAWYTLDGVRLSGKPTKKGLYINNGKKVVIE